MESRGALQFRSDRGNCRSSTKTTGWVSGPTGERGYAMVTRVTLQTADGRWRTADAYGFFCGCGRGGGACVGAVIALGFAGTIVTDAFAVASADPGRGGAAKRDAGVSAGIAADFFMSESGCTDATDFAAPDDTGGTAAGVGVRRLFGTVAIAAGGLGADGGGTSIDTEGATAFVGVVGVVGGVVADCAASDTAPKPRITVANVFIEIMVSP